MFQENDFIGGIITEDILYEGIDKWNGDRYVFFLDF
jgi:hypothetical protein